MRAPLTALLVLFLTSPLHAAGYQTVGTDVRAMGQGETGVATPDTPGNVYQNPAAAVASAGLRAAVGVIGVYSRLTADDVTQSVATLPTPGAPPNLHLSFATDVFGLGASLTVPFAARTHWPDPWHQRFLIQRSSLNSLRGTLFVAGKWGPLVVAAGPMLDRGSLSVQRALNFIEEEGQVEVNTAGTGLGAHASLYLKLTPTLSLGASCRSGVSLELTGSAEFDVPREFYSRTPATPVVIPLSLPAQGRLGLRWAPLSSVEISVEVEATQWSVVEDFSMDFENPTVPDVLKSRQWASTLSPRLGVSVAALPGVTLRGGLYRDPSPVPEATAGPESPDSTRLGATLGATVQATSTLSWNLGYQYLYFTGASAPKGTPSPLTFRGDAHLLGVSASVAL